MAHSTPMVTQRYTDLTTIHLQAKVAEHRTTDRSKSEIQGTA
jgi:hypothetical protein